MRPPSLRPDTAGCPPLKAQATRTRRGDWLPGVVATLYVAFALALIVIGVRHGG